MITLFDDTVFATSFDEKYMEYAKVMIKTLSQHRNNNNILLYCFVPEYLIKEQNLFNSSFNHEGVDIVFICSDKFTKTNFGTAKWFTKNSWHRIFIGSLLPHHSRVIYIDPDTMFLRDITPLLKYNTDKQFTALVQDEFSDYCFKTFGKHDYLYINDGVFIADLNFWRDFEIEDKLIFFANENGVTDYLEQDAMSSVLNKYVSPLPATFNFFVEKIENYETVSNPMIVHFNGQNKPWISNLDNKYHISWKNIYNALTY